MADVKKPEQSGDAAAPIENPSTAPEENTTENGVAHEGEEEQAGEAIFTVTVSLPGKEDKLQVMVSSQEQVHDIRQTVMEQPAAYQYSCFHLEHKGERINDFIPIAEVKDMDQESEFKLIEDPYTEKDARIHIMRIRELIGAAGDRTDTLHGISAGSSVHDSMMEAEAAAAAQPGAPPHALADYDFNSRESISTVLPRAQEALPKTIKSISISAWNPPPYHLRQKGHLLYLQLNTVEGDAFQITSHVSGFFVNKSTPSKFDPFPRAAPKAYSAHSLLTLISQLSASFESNFAKYQEINNSREPLSTFQITNTTPASPWLVPTPSIASHQSDIARTQENYLVAGVENTETLRDWNEEFQSTRELPKDTVQDRVFRERLTSKLFADYTDAAARGAILVARGEVAPFNPTEARDAQIFVYNNVFFSFGADGVGTFASEGGDEAARVATGKDVAGVRMVNQFDIDGLYTPGTVVVDYLGKRIVGQSIVPGIFKQRDPGENQIDYGAVDGKDVIASDEKFVPVFEKLSKALKVKKHAVWDKDGKRHDLEGSVETKGLLGTDGRKYVLDLYRITPLDIAWMEECGIAADSPALTNGASENAYPHRMTVLRPELVEAYWKLKMREWVNVELEKRRAKKAEAEPKEGEEKDAEKKEEKEAEKEGEEKDTEKKEGEEKPVDNDRIDISNFSFSLNPDAFSGQTPQTEEEKAELADDEKEVRAAATFLRDNVIPELVKDLRENDVAFPHDGQSLSRLLHKRGINIRYLGKLATLAEGNRLVALRVLSIQEMISRAFKHVAGRHLRYLPGPFATSAIAHLLNCLLGAEFNPKPVAQIDEELKALYSDADLSFQQVTPESLRKDIEREVTKRYRYTLSESWFSEIKHLQLLREAALRLGLQLEAKDYNFKPKAQDSGSESAGEVQKTTSSKNKKKKNNAAAAPVKEEIKATFTPDNILNIVPIIKEAAPLSSLAQEALEAGRIANLQNQKKIGQELLLESLSLHEQIYGILHPEVARVYSSLSLMWYQMDEKDVAVELAKKAVIIAERTVGIDSAEVLTNYLNVGLFAHANGDTKTALTYIKHTLALWKIIYGPNHPDSITTINNAAVMLQQMKLYHESRLWFEASLNICEEIFGKASIHSATLLFQLAQALALDNESKAAVGRMKEAYNVFLNELGPDDKNTQEASTWLDQLTQNAVSIAKHAKDAQARRVRAGIKLSPRVTLTQQDTAPQTRQAGGQDSLDGRSIDELLKFIEGTDNKKSSSKKRTSRNNNPKRRGGAAVGNKA